ncbi:Alcohol dehydrogenase-like protein [Emericellopsis cladophorae]|uniref:Alcohol dehydrogenase-like protein n=1 Tax=Emericellopsis cladophorae TaxID=2686198 RepID=A0A9P9XU73_9HYPO|nr:Alcohol dehydrogenase-like protein [Emericellopsis cladophorae]KAI6777851.1 Alcohol dehydrogenase-like protein [Emericellopsis cladophorae]
MKAGQYDTAQKKIVIKDIPIPEPAENQFLVKTHAASLCHSDLHLELRPEGSTTIGHEGVGYIAKIHPSAEGKGFKVGDQIGWDYFIGCCFECDGCLVHNLRCERQQPILQGFVADGYFQEYCIVDYRNAVIVPPELDMDRSAPLFCAGVTAYHAVDSCELKPGEWLAVVGCGGLGQYATQYAKAMGLKVVGVDISDDVLQAVTALGADAVVNSRTNAQAADEVKRITGKGAHAAAVFSGANAAYASAIELLRTNGLLMVIGIAAKDLQVSTFDLTTGRYRIKADSTSIPQRMPKAVSFTAKHKIQPQVEFRKLEELPQMVEDMQAGKSKYRQVVKFHT